MGSSGPPSNTGFLGPIRVHNSNVSMLIGSAIFGQMTAVCPYTLQWAALPPPLKNAYSHGGC